MPSTSNVVTMPRYSTEGLELIRQGNEARFTRDARAKFGDRFDYSQVHYTRQKLPVIISCPTHGTFSQTPDKHLQSTFGCPRCGVDARAKRKIEVGRDSFLKAFEAKYRGRLELLTPYVSIKHPITCLCLVHGCKFETTPDALKVAGYGCPKCAIEIRAKESQLSQDDFIGRLVSRFGDQFDLSKVVYNGWTEKVVLGCPIHGEFQSRPAELLKATHGCPRCGRLHVGYAETRIQRLEQGLVKPQATVLAVMKIEAFGIASFKIGTTSRTLEKRYGSELKEVLTEVVLDELDALRLEQRLHAKYFRWRDMRVFLAGLRGGKRWSGDSELYQEECIAAVLNDVHEAAASLESRDPDYWQRLPDLAPPVLRLRTIKKSDRTFPSPKPVIRLDTKTIFESATAAARAVGTTQGLVSQVCNGTRKTTKGVSFAYLSDYEAGTIPLFRPAKNGSTKI